MGTQRGFSLFELVMVIVVFGIVAAVAAATMGSGFRAYFTGRDIADTDWQARVALERMTRELRAIRAPADLAITSASDITFVDIDGASIRYCQATIGTCPGTAGELMRNSVALASGVGGLQFTYLTRTGAATGVPAQVFYVNVAFTVTQGTMSGTYQGTVGPRNFP
jgi:prepilin-type N-terminal cleavage/methylation domain-containing protein